MGAELQAFHAAGERAAQYLSEVLAQLRTDRASPTLVERISVEAYGSVQPIVSLGSISVTDARTLTIQAWDPQLGPAIGKAIAASAIGITPTVDGGLVRVNLPVLTTERREALLKTVSEMRETARIAVRTARDEALRSIRSQERAHTLSEDAAGIAAKELEHAVENVTSEIDHLIQRKQQELAPA